MGKFRVFITEWNCENKLVWVKKIKLPKDKSEKHDSIIAIDIGRI